MRCASLARFTTTGFSVYYQACGYPSPHEEKGRRCARPRMGYQNLLRPSKSCALARAAPVILNSPHSGSHYPAAFLAASRLDARTLRRSEDAYVDRMFAPSTAHGAPLLHARFPRAFLDLNREPYELDPQMFEGRLPDFANTRSLRVAAGLGVIPAWSATPSRSIASPFRSRPRCTNRDLASPLPRVSGEPDRRNAAAFRIRHSPGLPFDAVKFARCRRLRRRARRSLRIERRPLGR